MWKPNPQPSRTNVMTGAVGCGRTDESREACAFIENDDASTPQARTNDNLLNMDKTSLLTVSLGCAVGNGSTRRRFCHRSFRGRRGSPPRRDNKKSADRSRRPARLHRLYRVGPWNLPYIDCVCRLGLARGVINMAGRYQGFHSLNTGNIEIFWRADGWCWWSRAPGCPSESAPVGPFLTSTDAYLNANGGACLIPRPARVDRVASL